MTLLFERCQCGRECRGYPDRTRPQFVTFFCLRCDDSWTTQYDNLKREDSQ